ncbi:hypothetical protein GGI21_006078, partial [Coemansia aciculifera]
LDYTALDLYWPPPTSLPQTYDLDTATTTTTTTTATTESSVDKMGAVESLPSPTYYDHGLFGGDRHSPATSGTNKPVRSATISLTSCIADPNNSDDDGTGDKCRIKRAGTTTTRSGLFRASLRRYSSYRTPASWIHGKDNKSDDTVASKRMPSAEDVVRSNNSRYKGGIDAVVVPQLSLSMPHLPSLAETFNKGTTLATTSMPIVDVGESMPLPIIDFAASGGGAVTTFVSGGEQPPHGAASGIAEFRQRIARRLSR